MKKILLVDDDREFLEETKDLLQANGYTVVPVYDSTAVLKTAREIAPDVILVDIKMSGLNGFQVADRLNQSPDTAQIPVLAMTAHFVKDENFRLMSMLGIKDIFVKPIDADDLIACIERVTADRRTVAIAVKHIDKGEAKRTASVEERSNRAP